MTRTFSIPFPQSDKAPTQIKLIEPSLTADNLGHKTWLASYLLARRLPSLLPHGLAWRTSSDKSQAVSAPELSTIGYHTPNARQLIRIVELGSGTGLLGIAAAALLPTAETRLTDLPDIVGNLEQNVHANAGLFAGNKMPVVDVLDWSATDDQAPTKTYDVILASDPLYSPQHPAWLVQTIFSKLSTKLDARVIIELPLRNAYLAQVHEMRQRMVDGGLELLESGEESGREDWTGSNGSVGAEVKCWWGVWGWRKGSY